MAAPDMMMAGDERRHDDYENELDLMLASMSGVGGKSIDANRFGGNP